MRAAGCMQQQARARAGPRRAFQGAALSWAFQGGRAAAWLIPHVPAWHRQPVLRPTAQPAMRPPVIVHAIQTELLCRLVTPPILAGPAVKAARVGRGRQGRGQCAGHVATPVTSSPPLDPDRKPALRPTLPPLPPAWPPHPNPAHHTHLMALVKASSHAALMACRRVWPSWKRP